MIGSHKILKKRTVEAIVSRETRCLIIPYNKSSKCVTIRASTATVIGTGSCLATREKMDLTLCKSESVIRCSLRIGHQA